MFKLSRIHSTRICALVMSVPLMVVFASRVLASSSEPSLTDATECSIAQNAVPGEPTDGTTIFYESFEGSFPGSYWSIGDENSSSGLDYWGRSSYARYAGSYSGWCAQAGTHSHLNQANSSVHKYDDDMKAYMSRSLNLSGYFWATLSFRVYIPSLYSGDYLKVEYYNGSWHELRRFTSPTSWAYCAYSLPLNATAVRFYFYSDAGNYSEGAYIDEVKVLAGYRLTVFTENFEGSFPTGWTTPYDANSSCGYDYWGKSSSQKHGGSYSGWCAQVGTHSRLNQANSTAHKYDDCMDARMEKSVTLSAFSACTLKYYYWTRFGNSGDYLNVEYLLGSTWYTSATHSGYSILWSGEQKRAIPTSATKIRFRFVSDNTSYAEGAYIDDVSLVGIQSFSGGDGVDAQQEGAMSEAPVEAASSTLRSSPNPFTGRTMISYMVPGTTGERVSLIVYDAAGNVVRTLVNGSQTGRSSVCWDAANDRGAKVPGGVYVAKLRIGESVTSHRLILAN